MMIRPASCHSDFLAGVARRRTRVRAPDVDSAHHARSNSCTSLAVEAAALLGGTQEDKSQKQCVIGSLRPKYRYEAELQPV